MFVFSIRFFFKQKTAYEVRISDWSSDVCSSDLLQACRVVEALARADGSAGWNAQIIFGFNVGIGRFPKHVVEKVLGSRGDVRVRGALAPLGRAVSSEIGRAHV